MNQAAKTILRFLSVAVGTYYVFCGVYLFENRSDMSLYGTVVYFGAYIGQLAIGLILAGVGLGVISIRFGKEK
jgi:hypothetical protein